MGISEVRLESPGRPTGTCTGSARELKPDEITRLVQVTTSPRDRALVWLCLGAGLRIGEACTLTFRSVGSDGSLVVDASLAKSGKSRRVHLCPQGREALRAYLATMPIAAPSSPLFPRKGSGRSITPNWGVRVIESLLRAANITSASSHSLRRTHANTLRRSGADLTIIQGQLGHSSLATTAVYMSASQVEKTAAVDKIVF